jgi:elongation factor Ts
MSDVKISAADVKKLRDATGSGMMDCKKALTESGGDFDGAIEYLRKKGQKMAGKRADREAKEGVVIALTSDNKDKGIVVRLGCETDFVAKNEDFVTMAKEFANIALENMPASVEDLNALPYKDGLTIAQKIEEYTGVIGEKIEISKYANLEANGGQVVPYIHMGYRAGVIVAMNKDNADFTDAGKDVAMQVAAMRPLALDKGNVDPSIVEKEIEIGKDIARQEGKPEAIIEKIAMGKLNKFYKDNTLMNQQFVKDSSMTVASYLQSKDKDLTITNFKHIELG